MSRIKAEVIEMIRNKYGISHHDAKAMVETFAAEENTMTKLEQFTMAAMQGMIGIHHVNDIPLTALVLAKRTLRELEDNNSSREVKYVVSGPEDKGEG